MNVLSSKNVFTSNWYLSITTCTVLLSHWTMSSKTMKLKYHNTHTCTVSWYDTGSCITTQWQASATADH